MPRRTNQLIREYERLRKLAHELDVEANTVDERLVELESHLPDGYSYPGDPLFRRRTIRLWRRPRPYDRSTTRAFDAPQATAWRARLNHWRRPG